MQSDFYMDFKLHSEYLPTGDQPEAINELVQVFSQSIEDETNNSRDTVREQGK